MSTHAMNPMSVDVVNQKISRFVGTLFDTLTALVYVSDTAMGRHTITLDETDALIEVDELTIQNIVRRINPFFIVTERQSITVHAENLIAAIDDEDFPIHKGMSQKLAGAPRRDRRALAKIRKFAAHKLEFSKDRNLTITLQVPESIAGWTRLRNDCEKKNL